MVLRWVSDRFEHFQRAHYDHSLQDTAKSEHYVFNTIDQSSRDSPCWQVCSSTENLSFGTSFGSTVRRCFFVIFVLVVHTTCHNSRMNSAVYPTIQTVCSVRALDDECRPKRKIFTRKKKPLRLDFVPLRYTISAEQLCFDWTHKHLKHRVIFSTAYA